MASTLKEAELIPLDPADSVVADYQASPAPG